MNLTVQRPMTLTEFTRRYLPLCPSTESARKAIRSGRLDLRCIQAQPGVPGSPYLVTAEEVARFLAEADDATPYVRRDEPEDPVDGECRGWTCPVCNGPVAA